MSTISRKQQEIVEREKQILSVARQIFKQRGYLGLSMDRVAQQMQYAKGTIYQHFSNKEEIILAMAAETLEKRIAMFDKAVLFAGKPRERLAAIGAAAELFVKWFPDHFELEKVLSCSSIIEKTSEKLQRSKTNAETRCISLVAGVVREGIVSGDLEMPENSTPDQLVFGLWSITYGGYSIMQSTDAIEVIGVEDGFQLVRDINNRLLDGFGWRPLSHEQDYNQVYEQVMREIFRDGE